MKLTAIAFVVGTDHGQVIPGAVGVIKTADGTVERMDISNAQGYAVFNQVPVPFVGKVRLSGAAKFYEQDITIDGTQDNVTLRIGAVGPNNPQDIQLPGAVPFA